MVDVNAFLEAEANKHLPIIEAKDFVKINNGQIKDYYRIGKTIAKVDFGEIRMCVHRETVATRSVKVLIKKKLNDDERRMLFNEVNILKEMNHPNICTVFDFFEDEKRYYIVQESCRGNDLFDEILARGRFTERDTAVIIKQLLSCIRYFH